jgi:replicative DNA helicase
MNIENVIFENLIHNEDYARKVIPFLKTEYFTNKSDQIMFDLIDEYVKKYNAFPTKEALEIDLSDKSGLNEEVYKNAKDNIRAITVTDIIDMEWLVDKTEAFCKDKAIYNALIESIKIVDKKDDKISVGAIPKILSDALAVSFDTNIGHDFLEDSASRYEFYHKKEVRIPFDLDYLNKITGGGLPRKTLNIILAGTGVGKSLFMCHMAAHNLTQGQNVLYITLEMSEEKIAERIDANLLDTPLDQLKEMSLESYEKKIDRIRRKTTGKLIVKEYPTASAGSANFRYLLQELRLKKNFIPDVIYVDYLNICSSSRIKAGANVNSYTYVKSIAEELRGLAVEFNVPLISATQTTRSGFSNSDVGLEDTSESFGLPATADFMIAAITSEELQLLNQIMVKQLKNRYGDPNYYKKFVVGINRAKMKLYDVEESAQEDIVDDRPVMDKSDYGHRYEEESKPKPKFNKPSYKDFK